MEKIYFILLLSIMISGCNIFDSRNSSLKTEEIEPFTWQTINYFASDSITFINTTEQGEMFVGGKRNWYISADSGKNFQRFNKPDSALFNMVKKHEGVFYALGEFPVEEDLWGSPIWVDKQAVFISEDGNQWEKLIGPFIMNDIAFDDSGYMYIAKLNGVSAYNLATRTEYPREFYEDNWGGRIDMVATNSMGEIFAGCNGGIYKSTDKGRSWHHITGDIGRNYDDIKFLEIDENDWIISIAVRRLLMSIDNGETWTLQDLDEYNEVFSNGVSTGMYPLELEIMKNRYMYSTSTHGLNIAHPDSMTKFYHAGPSGYDFDRSFPFRRLKTFSNGDVLMHTNKRILFGKKNLNSEFWIKRS